MRGNVHAIGAYEWLPEGERNLDHLLAVLALHRAAGRQIVTTNGCFDLLHPGHVRFLEAARAQGDVLLVGLNSDRSVRRLKGTSRPLISEADRAAMLLSLRSVDHVIVFDDLLPNELLAILQPHIHCKAGDYLIQSLPEAEVVQQAGGVVRILPLVDGYSTSRLVERVQAQTRMAELPSQQQAPAVQRQWVVEQLMDEANLLRQTAYALSPQIVELAQRIARVCKNGGRFLFVGDTASEDSTKILTAAFHSYLERYKVTAHRPEKTAIIVGSFQELTALSTINDLLIAIAYDQSSETWQQITATKTVQKCAAAILLGPNVAKSDTSANVYLSAPASRIEHFYLAHQASLRLGCELAAQQLAELA